MKLARMVGAALLVLLSASAVVQAQDTVPDSLPYRAGQWGAEFGVGGRPFLPVLTEEEPSVADVITVGMLRFLSPRAALVMSVQYRSTGTTLEMGGRKQEEAERQWMIQGGVRRYAALSRAVTAHAGVLVGISSFYSEDEGFGDRTEVDASGFSAGGELGLSYHVTPRLALGAGLALSFIRLSGEATSMPVGSPAQQVDVSTRQLNLGLKPLTVSLFF